MIRCGADIIEISRIRDALEKNEKFLGKVFTEKEVEYFNSTGGRVETLAGFFAAKEAFVKFKKSGIRGLELSEISVEHEKSGAPFVVFRGERQCVSLSISHNKTHAIAVVCGEEKKTEAVNLEISKLIPKRLSDAHKGDCGRVFVVAGSEGMTGAAVLSAKGALRSGAGLVTVGTAKSQRPVVACGVLEAMTVALAEENGKISKDSAEKILEQAKLSDVVVFGPGLGQNEHIYEVLSTLLREYNGKLVIDADGLNALSGDCDILRERQCDVVITPHPGEMARLVKMPIAEIQQNRTAVALEFAERYGVCVLLKGSGTVVADTQVSSLSCDETFFAGSENGRVYINTTGNPGMATGGMGDVLSGVVASFMAQGLSTFDAAVLGAYIHGKAGDMATEKYGIHGLLAGDVAEYIAFAIKSECREEDCR